MGEGRGARGSRACLEPREAPARARRSELRLCRSYECCPSTSHCITLKKTQIIDARSLSLLCVPHFLKSCQPTLSTALKNGALGDERSTSQGDACLRPPCGCATKIVSQGLTLSPTMHENAGQPLPGAVQWRAVRGLVSWRAAQAAARAASLARFREHLSPDQPSFDSGIYCDDDNYLEGQRLAGCPQHTGPARPAAAADVARDGAARRLPLAAARRHAASLRRHCRPVYHTQHTHTHMHIMHTHTYAGATCST